MGKIRDYTYGSPKFERKINKAVSDVSTIYQHTIIIQGKDANDNLYYGAYSVYNNRPNSLFTTDSPAIADVVALIKATCDRKRTTTYLDGTAFIYFYVQGSNLKVEKYDMSNQQSSGATITSLTSLTTDNIREM